MKYALFVSYSADLWGREVFSTNINIDNWIEDMMEYYGIKITSITDGGGIFDVNAETDDQQAAEMCAEELRCFDVLSVGLTVREDK